MTTCRSVFFLLIVSAVCQIPGVRSACGQSSQENTAGSSGSTPTKEGQQALAATSHVLWLKPDGSVWAAGEQNDGARGDLKEPEYRPTFLRLQKLSSIVQITARDNASAALDKDGSVWVWGMFDFLNEEPRENPKQVPGLQNVRRIALGSDFLVALRHDGSIAVAGTDHNGLRGKQPENAARSPFSNMPLGNDNVAVGATLDTAFAVKKDGSVWGWGSKLGALLGRTSNWSFLDREKDPTPVPIKVAGLADVVSLACGHRHVLALTRKGDVYSWGDNEDGQLGVQQREGFAGTFYQYPEKIWGLPKTVRVSAGYDFSMAMDEHGKVRVFGSNTYGCLGVDEEFEAGRALPMEVEGLPPVADVFAGDYQAFVLLKDNRIAGWGMNHEQGSVLGTKTRTPFVPPSIMSDPASK